MRDGKRGDNAPCLKCWRGCTQVYFVMACGLKDALWTSVSDQKTIGHSGHAH